MPFDSSLVKGKRSPIIVFVTIFCANFPKEYFTTLFWVIITALFSYYVTYFARYDILYGNLSTIIMLMIWLYALCFVFVLGMAINATPMNNSK